MKRGLYHESGRDPYIAREGKGSVDYELERHLTLYLGPRINLVRLNNCLSCLPSKRSKKAREENWDYRDILIFFKRGKVIVFCIPGQLSASRSSFI